MTDPVIVEVTIAAPAADVWRALRDPDQIRRWHGWDYDGIEDEIREIYVAGAKASENDLTLDTGAGRFALEVLTETTTRVTITRAAPAGHDDWHGIYDEINEGWLSFTQQLRFYLERHRDEERRTLHVEHEVPVPDGERWFGSEHQTGVLLGDFGLLIVARGRTIAQ
jgi:uncharacterized protein YndB with AHSA1/START domain